MISYDEILTRVVKVANSLNGGTFHPSDIQQMRGLVICYDHLMETAKLIQESINEEKVKSVETKEEL